MKCTFQAWEHLDFGPSVAGQKIKVPPGMKGCHFCSQKNPGRLSPRRSLVVRVCRVKLVPPYGKRWEGDCELAGRAPRKEFQCSMQRRY